MNSRFALITLYVLLLATHFFYYPKWKMGGSEATISWDVSGYYWYLPSAFIYKDLTKLEFKDSILQKYKPAGAFDQAFIDPKSGNYVMKYSMGQAVQFLPAFTVAHFWATNSSQYPADGFSFPYQFMISMGSLIYMLIGLFFLRKVLLIYYEDKIVGWTMLALVLGTNYLNYSAIDGAMTHNNLFTLYTLLIYTTISFYKENSLLKAILIGVMVGIMALTRPTEIICAFIPIVWGINIFKKDAIKERFQYIIHHYKYYLIAVIITGLIGSLQLIYWKIATDSWLVYSYQDQGFSWLSPHIKNVMISYRSGWLPYSPMMIFALIGMYFLYKKDKILFASVFVFCMLYIYIVSAWDIWWYGGSLGQRAMVQSYPVWAFALAAFISFLYHLEWHWKGIVLSIMLLFTYANIWFVHQAHKGGKLWVGQMTGAYYWRILFTYEHDRDDLKLLDNNEYYIGKEKRPHYIFKENFNDNSNYIEYVDNYFIGRNASGLDMYVDSFPLYKFLMNDTIQYTPIIYSPILEKKYKWYKASAEVSIERKEWNRWNMNHFMFRFYNDKDEIVKEKFIRCQRIMNNNEKRIVDFEIKAPKKEYNRVAVLFWNGGSSNKVIVGEITVSGFD